MARFQSRSLIPHGKVLHAGERAAARACGLGVSIAIGACSGLPQLTPMAAYSASNVFSPAGYSQQQIDDTHFKVKATGTEATPTARLEKIARARAAEIGVENKLKYFKVTGVEPGFKCDKGQPGYKSEGTKPSGRPVVVLDVIYARDPAPGFLGSAETFKAVTDELAGEVVAPDASAAAAQQTRAGCGQG